MLLGMSLRTPYNNQRELIHAPTLTAHATHLSVGSVKRTSSLKSSPRDESSIPCAIRTHPLAGQST